jgi:hypothetical protein
MSYGLERSEKMSIRLKPETKKLFEDTLKFLRENNYYEASDKAGLESYEDTRAMGSFVVALARHECLKLQESFKKKSGKKK